RACAGPGRVCEFQPPLATTLGGKSRAARHPPRRPPAGLLLSLVFAVARSLALPVATRQQVAAGVPREVDRHGGAVLDHAADGCRILGPIPYSRGPARNYASHSAGRRGDRGSLVLSRYGGESI